MDENDFEGTLVLEKLAEIGGIDAFYEAIDADDLKRVGQLMRKAGVDSETFQTIMKKIIDGDAN